MKAREVSLATGVWFQLRLSRFMDTGPVVSQNTMARV